MIQTPRPQARDSDTRPETEPAPPPKQKRGIFRSTYRGAKWLAASPVQWMGLKSIRQGAAFIGDLTERARARSVRDPRFKTMDEGAFDLRATAFSMASRHRTGTDIR